MHIVKPNLRFNGAFTYGNSAQFILLHHADFSKCTVYDVHNWHLQKGWIGIGYHYFVAKDGTIYTGRPENALGSQCPGYNAKSIAICAEGNYMTDDMPKAQKDAIVELITDISKKYNIPKSNIKGHGDVYPTACPGVKYPKAQIIASVGTVTPTITPLTPPVKAPVDVVLSSGSRGEAVKSLQSKLIKLKFDLGKYGADGVYGDSTTKAIRKLQEVLALKVDGVAGNSTINAIDHILDKPLCGVKFTERIGTRYLQFRLGLAIDGVFWYGTESAVKVFQSRNGLGADGVVGTNTWNKLIG